MTQYRHIVQVHPVENGEINFAKPMQLVSTFSSKEKADKFLTRLDDIAKAVYRGCVDCATGELE